MSLVSVLLLASSAVSALQAALNASAAWTMTRRFEGSARALVSSGVVRCTAGEGIVWETREPFAASVTMTTNAMVFVDEDGRREKTLDDLPHYAEIRALTDAFVAGDEKAFDGVFELAAEAQAVDGWRIRLVPEVRAMRRLFASIELSGAETLTNVVLKSGDGGTSTIRFRELSRGGHLLWKDSVP